MNVTLGDGGDVDDGVSVFTLSLLPLLNLPQFAPLASLLLLWIPPMSPSDLF